MEGGEGEGVVGNVDGQYISIVPTEDFVLEVLESNYDSLDIRRQHALHRYVHVCYGQAEQ